MILNQLECIILGNISQLILLCLADSECLYKNAEIASNFTNKALWGCFIRKKLDLLVSSTDLIATPTISGT